MAKAQCPNCSNVSPIPDAFLGQQVRCRKCSKRFTAEALPTGVTGSSEGGTITVIARRVGAPSGVTRPGVFQKETMVGGAVLPVVAAPARPTGHRLMAALALTLPILLAGGFVAVKTFGGQGQVVNQAADSGADRTASGEVYGGVEIGSKGVNATVVELFPDPELDYDYRILWEKSYGTGLVKGIDKDGNFEPTALEATVQAVQKSSQHMMKAHGLPRDKVFIVVGSGPFKAVRGRKDLNPADKTALLAKSQTVLADAVQKATGLTLNFIKPAKEGELQFNGLIPQKHARSAVLVDVGSGASRGGYRDAGSGEFVSFEGPGLQGFADKVRAHGRKAAAVADTAAGLAEKELREPLREQLERKAGLVNRKQVYLNGGIVWTLATYQRPGERAKANVPLSAYDIEAFAKRVRAHPAILPPFPPFDGLASRLREKLNHDQAKIQDKFTHEYLVAGTELLRALSAELHFDQPGRQLYFTTYGQVSWLLGYIAERRTARK